jgi:hypothetical protein
LTGRKIPVNKIRLACAALLVAIPLLGIMRADATTRWLHYDAPTPAAPALVVKGRCLQGEDSAAHLRLVSFDSNRVVYGCFKRGY